MKANDIFVLSREEAMRFSPKRDTYVVRVFDKSNTYFPLQCANDSRIVWIDEFAFDYFDLHSNKDMKKNVKCALDGGMRLITRRDANELLSNFTKHFKEGMDLMAHCRYGINRSAGIATALNDLFDLGHNYLSMKHDRFDRFVYNKIIRAALFSDSVKGEKKKLIRDYLSSVN